MMRIIRVLSIAAVGLGLTAAAASAQTRPSSSQGPLVLEPSGDGFVVAPEVTFAGFEKGGGHGTLVGGYGGWLFDNKLLLGVGASFLVDHGRNDRVSGMGYGGFVAGWSVPVGRALHVGLKGLVGFGQAELTDSFTYALPDRDRPFHPDQRHGMMTPPPLPTDGGPYTARYRFWDDFFIVDPQATALVRLARGVALDVSGGYRLVSGTRHYDSWIRGYDASVGVRIGPRW
jgi:hypothetical protein